MEEAVRPEPSENGHPHENENNRDRPVGRCCLCRERSTGQGCALLAAVLLQMFNLYLLPAVQCLHTGLLWQHHLLWLLPVYVLPAVPLLPAPLLCTLLLRAGLGVVQLLRGSGPVCSWPIHAPTRPKLRSFWPRLWAPAGSRPRPRLGSPGTYPHGEPGPPHVSHAPGAANGLLPRILSVLPAAGLLADDAGCRAPFLLVRTLGELTAP